MIKIGILPTYNINDRRPFLDNFSFVSNYSNIIFENKAIPFGILFEGGIFNEEVLAFYDGFLIPGGSVIRLYHILTVHYAIVHNKPLLGICMGMQVIGIYSMIVSLLKKDGLNVNYENISNYYNDSLEIDFLREILDHNKERIFYNDSIGYSLHDIFLTNNTVLKNVFKNDVIVFPSIHNFVLKEVGSEFVINALSYDGYIEGIEYKNPSYFILGVQFHIEFENNDLFKYFIEKCNK